MRLGLGIGISNARGGSAAFSPLSLFASSERGGWYDPSDLTSMFQDTAGTVPVAADGDPVGRINDKSGNANHLLQATAGFRPLYKTSGGLHWLLFDGTDDWMTGTASPVIAGVDATGAAGYRMSTTATGYDRILGMIKTANADFSNVFGAAMLLKDGTNQGLSLFHNNQTITPGPAVAFDVDAVGLSQILASTIRVRKDADAFSTASPAITPALDADKILLGHDGTGSALFKGRVYGAIMIDRLLDSTEQSSVITYQAGKQGRTL